MFSKIICNISLLLYTAVTSFDKLLQLDVSYFVEHNRLSNEKRNVFITKLNDLRSKNVKLKEWLKSKGLEKYISGFYRLGYIDLESVQTKMLRFDIKDIITTVGGSFTDYQLLIQAVEELKDGTNRWIIISILYIFFRVATFLFKWLCKYYFGLAMHLNTSKDKRLSLCLLIV